MDRKVEVSACRPNNWDIQWYSPVNCVCFRLGGIFDVRLVQQILDAEQNLFDRDRRTPILLLVQQRQTHGARWVHVRMEQWWLKFAFGWTGRVVVFENHTQFVQTTFPWSLTWKTRGNRLVVRQSNETGTVVYNFVESKMAARHENSELCNWNTLNLEEITGFVQMIFFLQLLNVNYRA